MKIAKPLLLIGGALLVFTMLRAAKLYNGLSIQFYKISLGGKFLSPKIFATIQIQNSSPVKTSIGDINGKLFFKGRPVADIIMRDVVEVLPNETMFLDIEAQTVLPDVLLLIRDAISDNNLNQFSFTGSARIGGVLLPLNNLPLKW